MAGYYYPSVTTMLVVTVFVVGIAAAFDTGDIFNDDMISERRGEFCDYSICNNKQQSQKVINGRCELKCQQPGSINKHYARETGQCQGKKCCCSNKKFNPKKPPVQKSTTRRKGAGNTGMRMNNMQHMQGQGLRGTPARNGPSGFRNDGREPRNRASQLNSGARDNRRGQRGLNGASGHQTIIGISGNHAQSMYPGDDDDEDEDDHHHEDNHHHDDDDDDSDSDDQSMDPQSPHPGHRAAMNSQQRNHGQSGRRTGQGPMAQNGRGGGRTGAALASSGGRGAQRF